VYRKYSKLHPITIIQASHKIRKVGLPLQVAWQLYLIAVSLVTANGFFLNTIFVTVYSLFAYPQLQQESSAFIFYCHRIVIVN